jgi:hypothetical protein
MQKLTGISSGQNNKSCRIIHNGCNNIGFAFFCDFIRNLQESANSLLLFQFTFCNEALEIKRFFAMWPLGAAGRRGLANSGELAVVLGRGRARGWSRGTRGLICALGWWGEAAEDRAVARQGLG